MAKINIVCDTETKKMTVDVDGKSVDNVCCVNTECCCFYDSNGKESHYMSVRMETEMKEENGIRSKQYIYASKNEDIKKVIEQGGEGTEFPCIFAIAKIKDEVEKTPEQPKEPLNAGKLFIKVR